MSHSEPDDIQPVPQTQSHGFAFQYVELTADLNVNGNADAKLLLFTPGSDDLSATKVQTLKVYDLLGCAFGLTGEKLMVREIGQPGSDGNRRYVVPYEFGLTRKGKLDANLIKGGSAAASVWIGSDTGVNVTVNDWMLGTGGVNSSGKKIVFRYETKEDKWYVIAAECEDA